MNNVKLTILSAVLVGLGLWAAALVGVVVHAATVTSANVHVSTLEAGQTANHEFIFSTPGGVPEGRNMTLSFDSEFDLSTVAEDDIDIEDDGTPLTTASDCTGTEEAGVSVVGQDLQIDICSGDGGQIVGGSEVTVIVGDEANQSGTGSNQIINPPNNGTYYVTLGGTFPDSGSFAYPIGADDTIGVSATVSQGTTPGGGGGGGSGGGPQGDTTAPIISNVVVSNVTTTSADISWDTDENADGHVDYGETTSFEIGTESNTSLTTHRTINLSGLNEGVTYQFQVRSADLEGNEATDGPYEFTTPDLTAPEITNIDVVDITEESARVTWETNEPADSLVNYGETTSYTDSASDNTLTTDHSILLDNLDHTTEYHFEIRSSDGSGNESVSSDQIFETLENPPPANVSGLTVTPGDQENELSWTNPSDNDLDGVRVLACTDEEPDGPNDPDCTTIFDEVGESVSHTGLTNGTTYYYGVFAYDTTGQFASGALGTGTPSAPEEEVPPEDPSEEPSEEPSDEEPSEPPPSEEEPGTDGPVCGDGVCSPDETESSCPQDCSVEEEPAPEDDAVCGDGVCDPEEDADSCSLDCPAEVESIDLAGEIEFFVLGGSIELTPTNSGVVRFLANRSATVQLLTRSLPKPVDRVELVFGEEVFRMAPNFQEEPGGDFTAAAFGDDAYMATISVPDTPSSYVLRLNVVYQDGDTQSEFYTAVVEGPGYVFSETEGVEERIEGARVTLHSSDGSVWDGSPYGQNNPQITPADGTYAWYVPNGEYVVDAERTDYESAQSGQLNVSDNIVNPIIRMALIPEEEVPPPEEPPVEEPPQTPFERATENVQEALSTAQENLERVRAHPTTERAAEVSTPTLAVTAAAGGVALAVAFDLLPFFQYLFTAPILFFKRRKRKGYGVVYNAVTKQPIDLAIVRLFKIEDTETGSRRRLVSSQVTGKKGRYQFLVEQPGRYVIEVTKDDYTFPTEYLSDTKDDGEYLDVYHGEEIKISEQDATVTANIPLDPSEEAQTPSKIIWKRRLRKMQNVAAFSGVIISVIIAVLRPNMITYGMIGVQLVVYFLFRRLATPRKPKDWGIVYDRQTGRPVSNVVARIFEPEYDKLLDTVVTDSKGRYNFMLGPKKYYAVFEKPGYEMKEVRPIDYEEKEGAEEFALDLELDPDQTKDQGKRPDDQNTQMEE